MKSIAVSPCASVRPEATTSPAIQTSAGRSGVSPFARTVVVPSRRKDRLREGAGRERRWDQVDLGAAAVGGQAFRRQPRAAGNRLEADFRTGLAAERVGQARRDDQRERAWPWRSDTEGAKTRPSIPGSVSAVNAPRAQRQNVATARPPAPPLTATRETSSAPAKPG